MNKNPAKLVVRLKGGLGNQLFGYAAAFRLAKLSRAELIVDPTSGFKRDHQFRRRYELGNFDLSARLASPWERLEPLERYRRGLWIHRMRSRPYVRSSYIREVDSVEFKECLMDVRVRRKTYLDGYWQSFLYFEDVADAIRQEFKFKHSTGSSILEAKNVVDCGQNLVAVHVRDFDRGDERRNHNLTLEYYSRALELMTLKHPSARFLIFSDNLESDMVRQVCKISNGTVMQHLSGETSDSEQLQLMTLCNHFIVANSTFSWWGAWLGRDSGKTVIAPQTHHSKGLTSWGFDHLLPLEWYRLEAT